MKRLMTLTLAVGLCIGLLGKVHAMNDSMTVTITPNAYYSLTLASSAVALDLGTVNLGASTQTVQPATVTITSTYATTDIQLQGSIYAASDPWSFDDDTTTTESQQIASWAVFTSSGRHSAPSQGGGYFTGTATGAGSDLIESVQRYVGTDGGSTNRYEATAESDFKDMDSMPLNHQAHLWLYFRLPSMTISNNAQEVTVTLAAGAPAP